MSWGKIELYKLDAHLTSCIVKVILYGR